MAELGSDTTRRTVLLSTAATLAVGMAGSRVVRAAADPTPPPATGKPGDFAFLTGEWRIKNRKLKEAGVWDEFPGEATCWGILDGVGSVEELRIPARNFGGLGLRLLDLEARVWSDFWVNANSGVLTAPGTPGGFVAGVGTFLSEDQEDGKPVLYRGVWDRITPSSCRWFQGVSRDGGKTWLDGWIMDWRRVR